MSIAEEESWPSGGGKRFKIVLAVGESQSSVFGKNEQVRKDASPLFHVQDNSVPPFLLTYCQWDYFTLPARARQFHAALRKVGV